VRAATGAGTLSTSSLAVLLTCGVLWSAASAGAQRGAPGAPAPPATPVPAPGAAGQGVAAPPAAPPLPRAAAPIDLTGVWVSVITEDWRWRMVVPAKGDYASIPINHTARQAGDAWDPAKDRGGDACRAYGAPGLMRIPGRLRISWSDDSTLKVETDAGTQTRLLHFGDWKAPGTGPSRQGDTVASWEGPPAGRGAPPAAPRFGNLRTVTTNLSPGYLRKNGIPYSDKTTLTEYWDLLRQPDGAQWLVITTVVDDPTYLSRTWITSLNFKKEPDGSKWDPSPCSAT
jgi:hypothetical protein